jgi:uroporphyrinogen III methyltransferase/synthase
LAGESARGVDLPLSGRSVVVTRSESQASTLAGPLEALGAEVLVLPVIEIADPEDWEAADAAIERLGSYDWVLLTSANGVDALDARMRLHGLRIGDLRVVRVAAVGSATANRLRESGVEPAVVPERYRAEGLVTALRDSGLRAGERVLIARAQEAREVLPVELRESGAIVDVAPVYQVVTLTPPAEVLKRLAAGGFDSIVFASGGTARRFVGALAGVGMDAVRILAGRVVVSIGPVTTGALHELGIAVDEEAESPTSEAIVKAIVDRFGGAPE